MFLNSETLERYSEEIKKLCKNVLKYIAISLNLKDDVFEEMFGVAVQAVRMNYYPACPRPDLVYGLSPHSDGSALTVLQQARGSPVGLQILKDDHWVSVHPIPNALVINLGDTIEVSAQRFRLIILLIFWKNSFFSPLNYPCLIFKN